MLSVEDCDVEFLDRQVFESWGEVSVHVHRPGNWLTDTARLGRESSSEFERSVKHDRFRRTNPIDRPYGGHW
jgi:hypothetical protein